MTLELAVKYLHLLYPNHKVVMIELEDGGWNRFNFRLSGEREIRFIDFQKDEFVMRFIQAQKILEKF